MRPIIIFCLIAALCWLGCQPAAYAQADDVLPVPRTELLTQELTANDEQIRATYANQYYQRCINVRNDTVSEAARHDTCMCHSVHMLRHLLTPELETLATGRGRVSVNRTRLLPQVYAPCLEFNFAERELAACYESRNVRRMSRTQEAYDGICNCVSARMVDFLREAAEPLMASLIAAAPWIEDAEYEMNRSPGYMRERAAAFRDCINLFNVRPQYNR